MESSRPTLDILQHFRQIAEDFSEQCTVHHTLHAARVALYAGIDTGQGATQGQEVHGRTLQEKEDNTTWVTKF